VFAFAQFSNRFNADWVLGWKSGPSGPRKNLTGTVPRCRRLARLFTERVKNESYQLPILVLFLDCTATDRKLQLAFETKSLRDICENEAQAKVKLGETVAETLKHRLADLQAATSVKDLVAGRPRTMSGSAEKTMLVDLRDGYNLVFTANHPNNPVKQDKTVDWERVSRVKIMSIERDNV